MADQPGNIVLDFVDGKVRHDAVEELRNERDEALQLVGLYQERTARLITAAEAVVAATSAVGLETNQGRIGDSLRELRAALDA